MVSAPLPPDFRKPALSTPGSRRLLLVGIVAAVALVVLIVDIGPKLRDIMEHRKVAKEPVKMTGADVFVPRPEGAAPPALLPYEGMPAKAKDGTPLDLNEEPYLYLLGNLKSVDGQALARDAKRVDYSLFGKVPEQLKGQSVKMMGLLLQSNPIRLEKPVKGVEWIYRTYLVTDMSGQEGFVIDLLDKPPTLERKAVVRANVVFLKLGTYEGQKGQVQTPFFVGKNLSIVHEAAGGEASNAGTLLVVIAVAALLGVVFLTVRIGSGSGPKKNLGKTGFVETAKT
jgi:hypothetical protein